jgi:hypothetical protein
MTAQPGNVPLKCVVEEQANGKKCCKTHGYELEPVRISELTPIDRPNPVIKRAWRCPKGGTLIEIFKCRNCGHNQSKQKEGPRVLVIRQSAKNMSQ